MSPGTQREKSAALIPVAFRMPATAGVLKRLARPLNINTTANETSEKDLCWVWMRF